MSVVTTETTEATEKSVAFETTGREFTNMLEQGGPSGPLSSLGDPGDRLRDSVAFAISEAWRALDCDANKLHDTRFRVEVCLLPRTVLLSIRPRANGEENHE